MRALAARQRLWRARPAVTRKSCRYRHADKRKNNPEVGMVTPDSDPDAGKTRWAYDPHLDPALQFDVGRAQVETLIDDALASGDDATMRAALLRTEAPAGALPQLDRQGRAHQLRRRHRLAARARAHRPGEHSLRRAQAA